MVVWEVYLDWTGECRDSFDDRRLDVECCAELVDGGVDAGADAGPADGGVDGGPGERTADGGTVDAAH